MSQVIPLFLYPLGIALVCLLLVSVLKSTNRLSRALCVIAFTVLFLGGNRFLSDQLLWSLEKQFPVLAEGAKADVIIVLGGVTRPPSKYRQVPEIGEGGDRLTYAAKLYKEGRAAKILVSGGRVGSRFAEANSMADFLIMLGIPEEAIIRETDSTNTEQNAFHTKELMLKQSFESSLLVTSAGHMRRASKIFADQGVEHLAAPTDYRTSDLHFNWRTDILPEARHLEKTTSALKEYLGYLYLQLKS